MPADALNQTDNPAHAPVHTGMDSLANRPSHSHALQWNSDVPGPAGRWWAGVTVAALVALPLAWLLSYAAALPFFLGLFFFMLFGLIIGATAFRVAARGRPYSTSSLILGTTLLVTTTWGLTLLKEAHDFPNDVAKRVSLRTRDIGDRTVAEFRTAVAADVRSLLSNRYGPGPIWGYVRWVLTSGEIKRGELPTLNKSVSIPAAHVSGWWAFRVVASVALLGFGISSQTLLLRAPDQRCKNSPGLSTGES